MRRALPKSLPAWILLILVTGLAVAQIATLAIAVNDFADTSRSFELFRLGERTMALAKVMYLSPSEARKNLVSELANPSLTLAISDRPAVATAIAADDELAELEDILVAKLARSGVTDVRIEEKLGPPAHASPAEPVRVDGTPGDVEQQLTNVASNLASSGRFIVSVQFNDGAWLNFATPITPEPSILSPARLPSYVAVVLGIMLISLWAVHQLTAPYAGLVVAVKSIGEDLNRPPLPETGSPEVRAAAHAINSMQARLKDYVAEREHLAAALAHDLRTPLTRMRLRFELLRDSKLRAMLSSDVGEIESIIRSVVDFASQELTDESQERIDLVSLVQSVCDGFPEAELDSVAGLQRIIIHGRPVGLRRCIANLVENAIKYGESARVSIAERPAAVEIRIDDQGPGIPQAELEQVFQPFVRLEKSRNRATGGAGLGLAIARGIARAHGGEISLTRRPREGMSAILTLPVTPKGQEAEAHAMAVGDAVSPPAADRV